jgi:beta-glucosidase
MFKLFATRHSPIGICFVAIMVAGRAIPTAAAETLPYLDPRTPVESRVQDLLSRMTLDEKIGQMVQADLGCVSNRTDIPKYGLGSILSGGDSKPSRNTPEVWRQTISDLQGWALKSRLKIPLLYGMDAVHGHNDVIGTVIFPHNIGMGATQNPKLVEQAARITALEMAGTGVRWTFAPCVAVAQDERWGRTYESYSQMPKLVAKLGAAAIRGFQGRHLSSQPDSVLACAKHYLADGGTLGGHDQGNTICDEQTLRRLFLPPYRSAVKAGVGSIMVSFSSWNGRKMHGNQYLLTGVLKGELGFKGFLISDWAAIDQLSPDYRTGIETSINAGLDMAMIPFGPGHTNNFVEFIRDLKELVDTGKVPEARIDDAVSRILRVKFQMGLFEHPCSGAALTAQVGSAEHREVARRCVQQSLVLLKNSQHAPPLSKKMQHIVVVGKAADDLAVQCGGWTISWQGSGRLTKGTTILQAIRQAGSPQTEVTFSADGSGIKNADAVVVVVGEPPYAEGKGDRTNLDLALEDKTLVETAKASGAPVTTVLLSGRPLILGSAFDASDVFIAAWLPGTEGEGVADVLFGEVKPTGRLPREWPRNNDQAAANAMPRKPLFPPGFGLTY